VKSLFRLSDTKPLISIYVIFSYYLAMLLANKHLNWKGCPRILRCMSTLPSGSCCRSLCWSSGK
jgi:hypothetical protein